MTGYVKYAVIVAVLVCMISSVCKGQEKGYNLNEDGVVNIYTNKHTLSIPWGVRYVKIKIEKEEVRVESINTYEDKRKFKGGIKRKIKNSDIKIGNNLSNILVKYKAKKIIRDNEPPYSNPERGRADQSKSFLVVIDDPRDMNKVAEELRGLDGVRNVIPANAKFDANVGPIEREDTKQKTGTTPNDIEGNPNDPRLIDQWSLERNNKDGMETQWAWDYLSEMNISNNNAKIAIVEFTRKEGGDSFIRVKDITDSELEANIENVVWGSEVDSLTEHMANVSGIAAAESDNGEYISGAPYNAPASLHPFLLVNDIIELDDKLKNLFDFIKNNTEVEVINMSFHIDTQQNNLTDAADALVDLISEDKVVIASAPGDGKDYLQEDVWGVFPHRINSLRDKKVIRVGATNKDGDLYKNSSYGDIIDFCGSGEKILTTDADDEDP